MRSSKYNKKKGALGNKLGRGASKRSSEINEDFLAEFRELEKKQEELNRQNYEENNFDDEEIRVRRKSENARNGSSNGGNYETKVFSRADMEKAARNVKNASGNLDVEAANAKKNFQKKSFDSDSFEKNAMKNAYEPQNFEKQNFEKKDYLNEDKNKKKKKMRKKPKNDKKKPTSSFGKKLKKVLIILLILIAVCGVGIYYYVDVQLGKLSHVETDVSEFEIDKQVKKDLKGYRNIAVMGVDARQGEDKANTRTDAIIVASLNKKTGDVSLISVMRDTYLEMDGSTGESMFDKITHAHVYGGPVNTCKSLNKGLDLNISEFIVMDWSSVADTVDALGGITVDVQENEIYDLNHWGPETAANTGRTWTEIYNTGEQKIDGVQAATYCRIRKNSGGDTGRTERMRKVIMAILKEVKAHPSKITKVADKVLPEITTNMGTFDITTLLPQVINFDISKSVGYPYNYYGGSVAGSWKAVPTTLSSNAKRLHEEAFKQEGYVPTARLEEMSENIIYNTGISEGYEE